MMVKRYECESNEGSCGESYGSAFMEQDDLGNFVKFEDYEKLEAENEKLKKHIQSKYTAVWHDIKKSYDVKKDSTNF